MKKYRDQSFPLPYLNEKIQQLEKLSKGIEDKTLKLKNIDRNKTIKEFKEFINKEDKIVY